MTTSCEPVPVIEFSECSLLWTGVVEETEISPFAWRVNPGSDSSAEPTPVSSIDIAASTLPAELVVNPISYRRARAGERALAAARQGSELTMRGAVESAVPAIAGCHVVVTTPDGYALCCLRHPRARYQAHRWSVSFEEQIKADAPRDVSPVETARRGITEELGPDIESAVDQITLTAIGRENYREEEGQRLVRSVFLAMHASVQVGVDDLMQALMSGPPGIDRDENTAWIALSLDSPETVARSSSPADVVRAGGRVIAMDGTPGDLERPWHATSIPRLIGVI